MRARHSTSLAGAVLTLALLRVGCASPPTGSSYTDVFAYCSAVGDIDAPDGRYAGPEIPPQAPAALGLKAYAPAAFQVVWRCMGSEVYACLPGADSPCLEKADLDPEPNERTVAYCSDHRHAKFVPAIVTGNTTVYAWKCRRGEPRAVGQFADPDARGFLASLWTRVPPPGSR